MSLRKSPVRTAALLAACKANAQKSTGPRTPAGKARSRLNRLEHGRRCRKLHRLLPEGLSFTDRLRYNWIRRAIENGFRPATPAHRERALRLAIQVWCELGLGAKNPTTGKVTKNRPVRNDSWPRIRYRIRTRSKQSLTFWVQGWGRRGQVKAGEKRRQAQILSAHWHGDAGVKCWKQEPLPDPERDPMGLWHWQRDMKSKLRAFRRAQAREARRSQARQGSTVDLGAVAATGAWPDSIGCCRPLAFPDAIRQAPSAPASRLPGRDLQTFWKEFERVLQVPVDRCQAVRRQLMARGADLQDQRTPGPISAPRDIEDGEGGALAGL